VASWSAKQVVNEDDEFLLVDMGNEQPTAPKRKRKKYEILASAHPSFVAESGGSGVGGSGCGANEEDTDR
jgi:hypothetical protein